MRQAIYRLVVDGVDLSPRVNHRLVSLSLTEKRGADADELSLDLSDADGRLAIPPKGALIRLAIGWRDVETGQIADMVDKGVFKVDERQHQGSPDRLSIRARSADLTGAFRRRRSKSWSETTLGDVLRDVAERNSLTAVVDPATAARALPFLAQDRESDAALLARLGRRFDCVSTIKGGRLLFGPPARGVTPGGRAIDRVTLTRRAGDNHSWSQTERDAYSGVVAKWRDRAGATTREVTVGTDDNARTLGRTYASEAAARSAAEAEMKKVKRGEAEFSLDLANGDPAIGPETPVTVSGFKPEIDAMDWVVAEAVHAIDGQSGLTTKIKCDKGASESDAATGT